MFSLVGLEVRQPHDYRSRIIPIYTYSCRKDFDEIKKGETIFAGTHPDNHQAMYILDDRWGKSVLIGYELFKEHFEENENDFYKTYHK